MLITFCPQTYHLLWIKFFLISAHLPTLSKKPITGVGVKSNQTTYRCFVHMVNTVQKYRRLGSNFLINAFSL